MESRAPSAAALLAAALWAAAAFAASRPVTLNADENMYLDMARSGPSLEIWNGLEVVDSPELRLSHMVKRDGRLWAKYPPLYYWLARPAFLLGEIRGLIALNALGLMVVVWSFFLLARRVSSPWRAAIAATALPVATPLFPYCVTVWPHGVAAAAVTGALALAWAAWDEERPARAGLYALAAGLAAGLAMGVRMQHAVLAVVVVGAGAFAARRRVLVTAMAAMGVGMCLLAIAAHNAVRFGSPNPFSYGPAGLPGAPIELESLGYYLGNSGVQVLLATMAIGGVELALTWTDPRRKIIWVALLIGAATVVLAVDPSRHLLLGIGRSLSALLIDPSIIHRSLDGQPMRWMGWPVKSLLEAAPVLWVGLAAAVFVLWSPRNSSRPLVVLAVAALLPTLVLATRGEGGGGNLEVLYGVVNFGPRYLIEVQIVLAMLACFALREVRFGWESLALAVAATAGGIGLLGFRTPPETQELSETLLLLLPFGCGGMLALAWFGFRSRGWARPLAAVVAAAVGLGCAVTLAQDTRATLAGAKAHSEWIAGIKPAVRSTSVITGWDGAMHGIHAIRLKGKVALLDISVDDGASLLRSVDAFRKQGVPVYHFGLGIDRVEKLLDRAYQPLPAAAGLWELVPLRPPP